MELKPYQQKVINNLAEFISFIEKYQRLDIAYKEYWNDKGVFLKDPIHPDGLPAYKAVIPGVPHVAMKVPTAGGKTFIATNALRTIFDSFPHDKDKVVVWLVPSITILDQTVKNMSNPSHPYRQKLDTHFNGRVEIYEKDALLQGASFNSTTVKEQLSILVLSYDSFRTRTKDGRKVYQENENLTSFFTSEEESSLVNAINKLNPVIVVDESHNAESKLSIEMLNNLNPSFVLDLTATPRDNSNIISFVDSLELKKENMVKLPVLVYNHHDVNEVIVSSVELRNNLEQTAKRLEEAGGEYIRPIVLFQAQPKNAKDSETFEKVKEKLIKKGIPEDEIAIKTATINELKGIELESKDCKIRYIITINALKEGWDAPFAYILASLANRSSKVDVEQVLGRILRQPYVKKHDDALLNMSYVFTASQNFHDTLDSIIEGLNKSGFSKKDFRVEQEQVEQSKEEIKNLPLDLSNKIKVAETNVEEIDDTQLDMTQVEGTTASSNLTSILEVASSKEIEFEEKVKEAENSLSWGYPSELEKATKKNTIKEHFLKTYKEIRLPQFYISTPKNTQSSFNIGEDKDVLLSSSMLLDDDFQLKKQNTDIDFDAISLEVYQVDITATGKKDDYTPKYKRLNEQQSKSFVEHINSLPEEKQIKTLSDLLISNMGKMEQFADSDLSLFISRVLENMDSAMRSEVKSNTYTYSQKIKKHIQGLANKRKEEVFSKWIDSDKLFMKSSYTLPGFITPTRSTDALTKSLYIAEQEMNKFETEFISDIASLDNVTYWHKIIERNKNSFYLNGFQNHYPDFLIVTDKGNKVIVETKGDHLDGSDSKRKLKLGKIWANKAGSEFKYFMVFKETPIANAQIVEELIEIIKEL